MYKVLTTLLILLSLCTKICAQQTYSISGVISDAKGETLPAATIFLDGSQKRTYSNDKGEFQLANLEPGTYQLTVHFIGYFSSSQNVIITNKSVKLKILMKENQIALREVVIKNDPVKDKYMDLFLKNFLGQSPGARSCELLNPEVLNFSAYSPFVEVNSDDFLIIENHNLGYRIKYLLRNFKFNRATLVANFTGECTFENLEGTEEQKQKWTKNRKQAYFGSMMHYFRSLYRNELQENGFFTYKVQNDGIPPLTVRDQPLNADQIAKHTDSKMMTVKFPGKIYTIYDTYDRLSEDPKVNKKRIKASITRGTGSQVYLYLNNASVDAKGSIVDYRSFLIQGYWGGKRLGDQLPFEYDPAAK